MANLRHRPPQDDESSGSPALPRLPADAPAGKRWRYRRNLVIYLAHRQGLSNRFLADVFDLPRSSIAAILKEFAHLNNGGDGD